MNLIRFLFGAGRTTDEIAVNRSRRSEIANLDNDALRQRFHETEDVLDAIAIACEAAARTLALEMFDVQLRIGHGAQPHRRNAGRRRQDARLYPRRGVAGKTGRRRPRDDGQRPGPPRGLPLRHHLRTANEVGFDFLRDQIALTLDEQVHRPFAAAVIDEADSILIDEALARRVEPIVRHFERGVHFTLDEYGRNIALANLARRL